MSTPRFKVRRSGIGRRRWRVVLVDGGNREVLMLSEHLNSREAVRDNIAAVREAARDAEVVWEKGA